jgi:uncharacterized repeat protein (TIGR02543 family)
MEFNRFNSKTKTNIFLRKLLSLVSMCAIIMGANPPQIAHADITTGLVAIWSFDGNLNASAPAYNAKFQNSGSPLPTFVPSRPGMGQAVSMPSSDDRIVMSNDNGNLGANVTAFPAGSYTKAAWIRRGPQPSDVGGMAYSVICGDRYSGRDTHMFFAQGGVLKAGHNGGSPQISGGSVPQGEWRHVAVTYESSGGVLKIYVSGILVGTANNVPVHNDRHIYIGQGAYYNEHGLGYVGEIDDARVYSRALSSTDIAELAASGGGPITPDTKYTLSLLNSGTGAGSVSSSPAGISCGTDCSEEYTSGINVTLSPTPNAGSVFVGWSGGCSNTSGPCNFSINGNQTVTAIFNLVSTLPGANYYIAPYNDPQTPGRPTNSGTSPASPWDLHTGLRKNNLTAGSTVWLKGGTYKGTFISELRGTPEAPITVRSAPGEWAVLDSNVDARLAENMTADQMYMILESDEQAEQFGANSYILIANPNVPPTAYGYFMWEWIEVSGRDPNNPRRINFNERGLASETTILLGGRSIHNSGQQVYMAPLGQPVLKIGIAQSDSTATGGYTTYRNFEIRDSMTNTALRNQLPKIGMNVYSRNTKLVNLVMRNTNVMGLWRQALDTEAYGNLIYNQGWMNLTLSPGQVQYRTGHLIYMQHDAGYKVIKNNIAFNSFGEAFQVYGTGIKPDNVSFIGNFVFNTGYLGRGIGGDNETTRTLLFNNPGENVKINENVFIQPIDVTVGSVAMLYTKPVQMNDNFVSGHGDTLYLSNGADQFYRNTVYGKGTLVYGTPSSNAQNNSYYGPGHLSGTPPTQVLVRRNEYEDSNDKKVAHIAILNWAKANTVNIDASKLSGLLSVGDQFELRTAQNYFGAPLVSGTYGGGAISVPMNSAAALAVEAPLNSAGQPVTTFPDYGMLILNRVSGTPIIRHRLDIQKAGLGVGTVTGTGISCGADCTEEFDPGATVTLTATAGVNSTFGSWSGACTGTGVCSVTMNSAKNVMATFNSTVPSGPHNLSVSKSGNGSITGTGISCGTDCSESFPTNTSVTLSASPDSGWQLSAWGGACTGTGSCVVTMDSAKSVSATFIQPPPPPPPGSVSLLGHWRLDETSGITASDSSGQNHPGTLKHHNSGSLPQWTSGNVNGALDFDGVDDYVELGNIMSLGSYTKTAWVRPEVGQAPNYNILSGMNGHALWAPNRVLKAGHNGSYSVVQDNVALPLDTWTHVALTYDSTAKTLILYKNGNVIATATNINATTDTFLQIGNYGPSNDDDNRMSGKIDEARLYNGVLTRPEIQALMTGGTPPPTTYLLSVTKEGLGAGTVMSVAPTGINCGGTCSASFNDQATVTLEANPTSGNTFAGWGGACSGTGSCVVTMTSAKNVTATFNILPPTTYTLHVSNIGNGRVAGTGISCGSDCTEAYVEGTLVTLTATPDGAGWVFDGWSGACSGTGSCNISMDAAKNVAAIFSEESVQTNNLLVSKIGSGTISGPGISCGFDCSEAYANQTTVTLTAVPDTGWKFQGWSGDCFGTTACVITVTEAKTAVAQFELLPLPPPVDVDADLYKNYFNPLTGEKLTIGYTNPEQSQVQITVYAKRHKVRSFVISETEYKGSVLWDGRNDQGEMVASGTYHVLIEAGSTKKTVPVIVVK